MSIKNTINNVINKAKNAVASAVKVTTQVTSNLIKKVKNTIASTVKAVKDTAKKVIEKTKEIVYNIKESETIKSILECLKDICQEIKEEGFFDFIIGRVTTGALPYIFKIGESFISGLRKDLKNTYGNNAFTNFLDRGLEFVEKGAKSVVETCDFLETAVRQVVKGNYAEETNWLGTVGEIALGFVPIIGTIADARDLVYCTTHWENSWMHAGITTLTLAGFIPGVGDVAKHINKFEPVAKVTSKLADTSIIKGISKIADTVGSGFKKIGNSFVETVNKTVDGCKEFISKIGKGGRELLENAKTSISKFKEAVRNFEIPIPRLLPETAIAGGGRISSHISIDTKSAGEIFDDIVAKFSKNADEVGSGVKIGGTVDEVENTIIDNKGIIDGLKDVKTTINKKYANSRPSYGKNQIEQVWENAMDPVTGKVYDPSGVEIIWDRTIPRNGQWDMGHIPGQKYSEMHKLYMEDIISEEEFLNWYRDPNNYRPELPSTNRSHKYE